VSSQIISCLIILGFIFLVPLTLPLLFGTHLSRRTESEATLILKKEMARYPDLARNLLMISLKFYL
jgi:hypothetical protein